MFSQEQQDRLQSILGQEEWIPIRLRNHDLTLIAQILESGRTQRFFGGEPIVMRDVNHDEFSNTVRELRWEGYLDIDTEDVDGDGVKDDVMETGWKTNDSGIEFLRRLKAAAGFE